MKFNTVLIVWHNKEPVYSIDFHPSGRIATAGADQSVKIWRVSENGDSVEFLASLRRHTSSVNIVRFSPNGEYLASAADDGAIFVWKHDPNGTVNTGMPSLSEDDDSGLSKECWTIHTSMLKGGKEIYSLDWSPNSQYLISGSIDTTVCIWNTATGQRLQEIREHTHYVQGTGWDPRNIYIVTQSIDRCLRIYKKKKGPGRKTYYCANVVKRRFDENIRVKPHPGPMAKKKKKAELTESDAPANSATTPSASAGASDEPMNVDGAPPVETMTTVPSTAVVASSSDGSAALEPFSHKLFLDENVNSFFRRLCWSPCGMFLFCPTAMFLPSPDAHALDCTYIFMRGDLVRPIMYLESPSKPSVIVRCNPVIFKNRDSSAEPLLDITYRLIWAIATLDSVLVYDSQVSHPIAFLNNIHYASLSDLSWSADGLILGITSSDGYCSFVKFDPEEFGPKLEGDELEVVMKPVWDARVVKESEPETPLKDGEKMDVDTPDVAAEGKADAMDTDDAPKSTHTAPAPGGAAKKPRKRIAPVAIAPSQSIATAAANAAPQAESTAAPTTTPAEPDAPATADSKQQRKRIQPTLLSFAGAGTTTPPEQAQPADAATTST